MNKATTLFLVLLLMVGALVVPAMADNQEHCYQGDWTIRLIHVTTPTSSGLDPARIITATNDATDMLQAEGLTPRWETNADCEREIHKIAAPSDGFHDVVAAIKAAGLNQPKGRQIAWVDGSQDWCGLAITPKNDPLTTEHTVGVVYCWRGSTAVHELFHSLGAVNRGSPASDGSGHSRGEVGLMCGSECRPVPGCTTTTFDCSNNSYFNPDPHPGTWLYDNPQWNVALSPFFHPNPEPQEEEPLPPKPIAPPPDSPTSRFPDTVHHEHQEAIERLAELGIIEGYADGLFRPQEPITRAQAAAMIDRLLQEIR